jgi:hypothetical protein
MKRKTKKFASGGDILTGIGLGMIGYDLYKKLKDKDKDDSDYARKVKEFRSGKKDAEAPAIESKAEPKEEPKTISAGEKRAMAASKGRPELIPEGADEAVMRSDNYPTPKPKKATPKSEKPKNVTPAAQDTSGEAPAKLGSQGNFKFSTSGMGPKNTFLTKERLDKAQDSMRRYREEQKKKQRGADEIQYDTMGNPIMKRGGMVSSASKRADGIAQRGKTRGRVL